MGWMFDIVGRLIARLQKRPTVSPTLRTIRRNYATSFDPVMLC
jgi:hypothetical protein